MQNKFFKENRVLGLILLGAFLLPVFYSFHFKIKPQVDAQAYDNIGYNISIDNGYRSNPGSDIKRDGSITRVGPLYEYFLGFTYKIFGHSYGWVWVFQALLHSLTALFVYLTCLLVFSEYDWAKRSGLWAAAIIGFYPDLIEISAMLLTETFYLFLLALFVYFFFLFLFRKDWLSLSLAAIFAGLGSLARPTIIFLIPAVYVLFWLKRDFKKAVIFTIILAAVFTPWTVRNYLIFHKIMPFGASGAFNFWIGNYHGGSGEQEPTKVHLEYMNKHGMQELQDESIRQFKLFLKEYPGEFVKITLLRVNKYFSIIRPMGFWFYQQGLGKFIFILCSAAASVLLFISGLAGIFKSWKLKNEKIYYLLAFIVLTPLINFITVIETRYRFQVYPLLAVFAGFFIAYLFSKGKDFFRSKEFWLASAIVVANGLTDLLLSFEKFKERLGGFF